MRNFTRYVINIRSMNILGKFSQCENDKYLEVVVFKTGYSTVELNILEQILIVKTKSLIFYQALAFCSPVVSSNFWR